MSIGSIISGAINEDEHGNLDASLILIFCALDSTAKELYPGEKVGERIAHFINDNMSLISRFMFGRIVMINPPRIQYFHPDIRPTFYDNQGLVSLSHILYLVARCSLIHDTTLPVSLKFEGNGVMGGDDNELVLPVGTIHGLLASVICSRVNAKEKLLSPKIMNFNGVGVAINDLWGDASKLLTFLEEAKNNLRTPTLPSSAIQSLG